MQNFRSSKIVTRSMTGRLPPRRIPLQQITNPLTGRKILNSVENRERIAWKALKSNRANKLSIQQMRSWLSPRNGRVINPYKARLTRLNDNQQNRLRLETYITQVYDKHALVSKIQAVMYGRLTRQLYGYRPRFGEHEAILGDGYTSNYQIVALNRYGLLNLPPMGFTDETVQQISMSMHDMV